MSLVLVAAAGVPVVACADVALTLAERAYADLLRKRLQVGSAESSPEHSHGTVVHPRSARRAWADDELVRDHLIVSAKLAMLVAGTYLLGVCLSALAPGRRNELALATLWCGMVVLALKHGAMSIAYRLRERLLELPGPRWIDRSLAVVVAHGSVGLLFAVSWSLGHRVSGAHALVPFALLLCAQVTGMVLGVLLRRLRVISGAPSWTFACYRSRPSTDLADTRPAAPWRRLAGWVGGLFLGVCLVAHAGALHEAHRAIPVPVLAGAVLLLTVLLWRVGQDELLRVGTRLTSSHAVRILSAFSDVSARAVAGWLALGLVLLALLYFRNAQTHALAWIAFGWLSCPQFIFTLVLALAVPAKGVAAIAIAFLAQLANSAALYAATYVLIYPEHVRSLGLPAVIGAIATMLCTYLLAGAWRQRTRATDEGNDLDRQSAHRLAAGCDLGMFMPLSGFQRHLVTYLPEEDAVGFTRWMVGAGMVAIEVDAEGRSWCRFAIEWPAFVYRRLNASIEHSSSGRSSAPPPSVAV